MINSSKKLRLVHWVSWSLVIAMLMAGLAQPVAAQDPSPADTPMPTETADAMPADAVITTPAGMATITIEPPRPPLILPVVSSDQPGEVTIEYHAGTGKARFMAPAEEGHALAQPSALSASASAEDAARNFLAVYGKLFGLKDQGQELTLMRAAERDGGRSSVRLQQVYEGIPVLAGEIIVNLDGAKNVLSVSGEILPDIDVDTTPAIDAAAAQQAAIEAVSKEQGVMPSSLTASEPELWIYNPVLLVPWSGPTVLTWRIEVIASESPIDELVLINAQRGGIALAFNQIDTEPKSGDGTVVPPPSEGPTLPEEGVLGAPQISIYTMNHATSPLPGTLVCTEGNPTPCNSDTDANLAYLYAARTYYFYASLLGRDSIDGAGRRIGSSVHYGSGYQNAFWDGNQMVYGDGFSTAEDVVGHELTHGVTQYESNLFYYYQSGAINESLSDVFGEFVEKYYEGDPDWLMGEDLSIGAIRDMSNPPAYSDPDKITSTNYYIGTADNGGVHTNSGVNNKAAYLMTTGGSFNGYTITGLGLLKVANIYYEVNADLLTSGSDYYDLNSALYQGCINLSLSGTAGITSADCTQVRNATQAVEMHYGQPSAGFNPNAPICPTSGQVPNYIFNDGFENGTNNFVGGNLAGTNPWYWVSNVAHTGLYSMGVDDVSGVSASYIRTDNITIPAGAYLHFDHLFDFEPPDWDGGVIEYTTNSGASWNDAGSMILSGIGRNYTGTVATGSSNPLAGRAAFVGSSHGYVGSTYDLSPLAGQTVMFRWLQGTDEAVGWMGWVVDDVKVYTCRPFTRAPYDFDSDGATEVSIYRPSTGMWYVKDLYGVGYGAPGDIPVPADYNGDGRTDFSIYRPSSGMWYVKDLYGVGYGAPGDIPVPADYNGDGTTDIAVYRPSSGVWYVKDLFATAFGGVPGDIPVPADYNGDGRTDVAIYRSGMWYVKDQFAVGYGGMAGDIPVPADYDGNGTTDIAVYRNGMWYVKDQFAVGYGGVAGDIPVPADYNGDGRADVAIYRNGMWYVKDQFAAGFGGAPGDYPIPAPDTNGDGDPYQ